MQTYQKELQQKNILQTITLLPSAPLLSASVLSKTQQLIQLTTTNYTLKAEHSRTKCYFAV